MRMGGGPQQFGVDAEQVPALLAELAPADLEFLGFHIFAGSQNLNAEILCEAQRKTVELVAARWPTTCAACRSATSTSAAASASPTSRRTQPLDLGRDRRRTSHELLADAHPPEPARRPRRDRARPLHRRRVRRLRDPRRRPQGVARQDLPGRRRRPAPPARRVRQLRPGDPAQLPGRDRQPRRDADATETVTVVGCLCTPLDLLGRQRRAARAPRSATSSSSSRPAPTG